MPECRRAAPRLSLRATPESRGPGDAPSRGTAAAAAGRLDHEHVANPHLDAGDVIERVDAAVGALDAVDSRPAGAATRGPEGAGVAPVRQDRRRHRLEKTDPAHAAVAAAPAPRSARPGAQLEAVEADREAELEHLGVGEARVG